MLEFSGFPVYLLPSVFPAAAVVTAAFVRMMVRVAG